MSAPTKIVDLMMDKDYMSQWLGIERIEESEGSCTLRMKVRKEMLNGFGIAHGGITYSFADSAFAFASNSRGKKAVSIETSISHLKPVNEGDVLTATTKEIHVSNKIGTYQISITNQLEELVAAFKGTVYRTGKDWI